MRFLGLTIADDVPDSKTIWLFRERLTDLGLVEILFETFIKKLEELNLIIHEGKIIDASFVEVPRQRNSRDENEQIKAGQTPHEWLSKPNKLAQKDVDARWTKKNEETFYGYKNHIKTDSKSKLITAYEVTDSAVHDSQPTCNLLDAKDEHQPLHADSAYVGAALDEKLREDKKVIPQIIEKGYRNHPLTEDQKKSNKEKSKTRVRVEHVFGFVENSMNGSSIRSIGKQRCTAIIGLINLVYNMFRKTQIA
jgi:IS5 family transposase